MLLCRWSSSSGGTAYGRMPSSRRSFTLYLEKYDPDRLDPLTFTVQWHILWRLVCHGTGLTSLTIHGIGGMQPKLAAEFAPQRCGKLTRHLCGKRPV